MKTIDILFKVLFGTFTLLSFLGLFLSENTAQFVGSMFMTAMTGLGFYILIKFDSHDKL
jgi:hypothetical protein